MIAFLRNVQLVAFVGLALVAFREWRRRKDRAAGWVATAFGTLAGIFLLGRVLTRDPSGHLTEWVFKSLLAIFVLFPYLLYRFMSALKPPSRWLRWLAGSVTAVVVGGTFLLPHLPKAGSPRPPWLAFYAGALLVEWTVLSVTVAARLWRAGATQPALARARMRLLSLASAGLNLGVVIGGATSAGGRPRGLTLAIQVLMLVTAALFYLGFAPPRLLRSAWRQREWETHREAVSRLMSAKTVEEVAGCLLPAVSGLVGAQASALVDARGGLIGAHGLATDIAEGLEGPPPTALGNASDREVQPGLIRLPLRSGALLVWASPYMPYFGTEELDLLRSLADFADLALDRCELFEQERKFIAAAAHELRTPLTTIAGMAATLDAHRKDMSAEMLDDCMAAINRQGERVRVLIQNLLDLSQLEHRSLEFNLEHVSLAVAGQRAIEVAPPPPGRSVDLEIDDGVAVLADPARLEQALTNLLTNAYRYGGPVVHVEAEEHDNHVILSVSDNGDGVPADFVPHMFDPFARGASNAGTIGSGLGLSITQRLIEAFGGQIRYEPAVPGGARFNLQLRKAGA